MALLEHWIAQAPCVPASSLLKRIQIKRDNTVISSAASTPSSDEEYRGSPVFSNVGEATLRALSVASPSKGTKGADPAASLGTSLGALATHPWQYQ